MAATPSGKDKILRWARLYASGYDLSGDARTFGSCDLAVGEVERGGWSEAHRHFILDDVYTLGIRGFQALMNDATAGAFTRLSDTTLTSIVDLVFGGGGEPAIGDPAYMLLAEQFNAMAEVDDRKGVLTADFLPDQGQYEAYQYYPLGILHHDAATQITATKNATSVDWGAAHTAGGWANLHVLTTASGDYAFKLQHSTNDADWSDISGATWTIDGSAIAAESTNFAGTINRYTRFVATRTAGSIYAVVTVALLPYVFS